MLSSLQQDDKLADVLKKRIESLENEVRLLLQRACGNTKNWAFKSGYKASELRGKAEAMEELALSIHVSSCSQSMASMTPTIPQANIRVAAAQAGSGICTQTTDFSQSSLSGAYHTGGNDNGNAIDSTNGYPAVHYDHDLTHDPPITEMYYTADSYCTASLGVSIGSDHSSNIPSPDPYWWPNGEVLMAPYALDDAGLTGDESFSGIDKQIQTFS